MVQIVVVATYDNGIGGRSIRQFPNLSLCGCGSRRLRYPQMLMQRRERALPSVVSGAFLKARARQYEIVISAVINDEIDRRATIPRRSRHGPYGIYHATSIVVVRVTRKHEGRHLPAADDVCLIGYSGSSRIGDAAPRKVS